MNAKAPAAFLSLTVALLGNCLAFPTISENFDAAQIDQTRWFRYTRGHAKLVQEGGLLHFASPTRPTLNDFGSLELLTTYPGYFTSWQMLIELTNVANAGDEAASGFMIFNTEDRRDYLYLEFYGKDGINVGAFVNSKAVPGTLFVNSQSSHRSIRVRYDDQTKLFTFWVFRPLVGNRWAKIGTFSPKGQGGTIRANWRMGPKPAAFGIHLFGIGRGVNLNKGEVTLDNFKLSRLNK